MAMRKITRARANELVAAGAVVQTVTWECQDAYAILRESVAADATAYLVPITPSEAADILIRLAEGTR